MKIDTEGHELQVLFGAIVAIQIRKIEVIQIEFNEMNVISKTFFKNIYDLLNGYHFFRLLPDGLVRLPIYRPIEYEIFAFQNIAAIQPESTYYNLFV